MRRCEILYLLIFFLIWGCINEEDSGIPDFSSCKCPGYQSNVVCGEDGRTYLDSCLAKCMNIQISQAGSCQGATNDPNDTMKWEIRFVCIPVIMESDPQEVSTLRDGSVLYRSSDGTYFRGTPNLCRCLPPYTLIATPIGPIPISNLQIGDIIWSADNNGNRLSMPIAHIRKVPAPANHKMVSLKLEDGRQLAASPMHPDVIGRTMLDLKIGDCLDGSQILEKKLIAYSESYTWDLLAEGETGFYFANDILIASTIRKPLL